MFLKSRYSTLTFFVSKSEVSDFASKVYTVLAKKVCGRVWFDKVLTGERANELTGIYLVA
jgi:hypothetical protein